MKKSTLKTIDIVVITFFLGLFFIGIMLGMKTSDVLIIEGIALVRGLIFGIIVMHIMQSKGYDPLWFLCGFYLGVIGLIIALCKPSLKKKHQGNNVTIVEPALDNADLIRKYAELYRDGLLTKEEYEKKKDELLNT